MVEELFSFTSENVMKHPVCLQCAISYLVFRGKESAIVKKLSLEFTEILLSENGILKTL